MNRCFNIEYLEESSLTEEFTHFDYSDPDSYSNFYSYSKLEKLSKNQLIDVFINEVLDGDHFTNWNVLTESNAKMLLRKMALTDVDQNGKKKKSHNSNEAKFSANLLTSFMGNSTEYYSNVESIDNPHDNPGKVTSYEDGHSEYDSICLIAVNDKYLLYLEQAWNFRGE